MVASDVLYKIILVIKFCLNCFYYLPTGTAYLVGELFPIPVEIEIFEELSKDITTTPKIVYKKTWNNLCHGTKFLNINLKLFFM